MKAQMFIVTMIFLVGLIFTVQQILLQYTFLDMPSQFQKDDFYVISNIRDVFNSTLRISTSCPQATDNLNTLKSYLEGQSLDGRYNLDFENTLQTLNCSSFGTQNPSLTLKIHLTGPETDTRAAFNLYK